MDTRKLQALLKTVQYGSINKTAEAMEYTQAGLTYLLNSLETEIGLDLLERKRSGVALTAAGSELMPYIENIIKAEEEFTRRANQLQSPSKDMLRIGCYSSVAVGWMAPVIEKFRQYYPDLPVDLKIGNMNLLTFLENDEIELAVVDQNLAGDFSWTPLYDDQIYLYLPRSHPLAKKTAVAADDFTSLSFIFPTYDSADYFTSIVNSYKPSIRSILSVNTLNGSDILQLVSQGLGVTVLSGLCMPECPANICAVPFEPAVIRPLGMITKPGRRLSVQMNQFVRILQKHVRENS